MRLLDVRGDEARPVLATFGSLLLIVVAHTILETVRDALFLAHLGSGALGPMYIVAAGLTLLAGSASGWLSARFSARRTLVICQLLAAAATGAFFILPPTRAVLMSLYGLSAVTGALLVPQVWAAAGGLFDAAQSRRLFGTIAIAGIGGAVLGSAIAAATLTSLTVSCLFVVAALAFAASALAIGLAPKGRSAPREARKPSGPTLGAFRDEPILIRIAAVVSLGAVTMLLVDYVFKSAVARTVPPEQLGPFFARYGVVMNVLAFVVQLAIARRVLARAGVIGTAAFMPSLLFTGSALSFLTGGALLTVLGTKVVDASLRHSVHRTGLELVYLAVPARARDRAKPLIDGAFARVSQALGAGLVLLLGAMGIDSIRLLALLATGLAAAWGAATYALRAPYLSLFRRSILGGAHDVTFAARELDLASVEVLVEALGSPRPREVIAAMSALARRDRGGLIPALVLLHEDEEVLERACEILGASTRKDWVRFAERLSGDPRERVRRAALRALARSRAGASDPSRGVDPSERPWIRGYLTASALSARGAEAAAEARSLVTDDERGREAVHGILTALGDSPGGDAPRDLLVDVVAAWSRWDAPTVALAARAASRREGVALLPFLLDRLAHREGRPAVRSALAAIGTEAYDAVEQALLDGSTPRKLRIHLPRTLEVFASQRAADALLEILTNDPDGLVRYKALRALGRLVADRHASVSIVAMKRLARRDLLEHFRVLGLEQAFAGTAETTPFGESAKSLIVRLLREKAKQSLERVFRIIKICFVEENIHRVYDAATNGDPASRANAAEFLDALLAPRRRREEDGIRGLLRLVMEDLPLQERVARAAALEGVKAPAHVDGALELLQKDSDPTMAKLAADLAGTRARPTAPSRSPVSQAPAAPVRLIPALGGSHG